MTLTPTRRWSIILVGSLAVNIFLLGAIVAGMTLRGPGGFAGLFAASPPPPPRQVAAAGFESFSMPFAMISLGEDVRPVAREIFKGYRREFGQYRRALGQGRRVAVSALAQPEFDAAALEGALKELRSRDLLAREVVHRSIVEFAAKLTPEQRKQFAEAITVREAERIKHIKERRRRFKDRQSRDQK
ncbi:MAG: periplasmic heavy metal sensor [Proteobacteria bacterium]|nr:periplasmic heavy metal sensor [Pseudomonadota bacterium]